MHSLAFHNTHFDIIDRNHQPWLRSPQIAEALGYSQANRIADVYNRNADEFTDSMTALVELDTNGGKQHVRIFSLRGVHLLAMLSRTKVAKEFRHWVLDVLEGVSEAHSPAKPRHPKATSPRQQARQVPLLPASRNIRSRDDLSFTKRDAEGRMLNWFMPSRENNWHEHYGIGEIWFSEIVELARHNPEEAYRAMYFAGPELTRYWSYGHPNGFFDRMARWAMAAILANPTEPQLPFDLPCCGIPPREGMDFHLAAAPAVSAPDACRARRYRQAGVAEGCIPLMGDE